MSKIQEALRKLQSEGAATQGSDSVRRGHGPVLARISRGSAERADLEEIDNGPCVEIDQEALRDAGLIAPDYHEHLLADQYRNIKRPLIANAFGKKAAKVENGTIIMITSAIPGEGKTFTAMNLAISIAQELDHSALLVDADVAKPHMSSVFGLAEMPGLLDFLDGSEDRPESLILRTDMRGLSILPAGKPRPNATELLSRSRMENLVQELATRFPQRIMIFDTPPLLHTSESRVITNIAGQVVLVVKAESTPQGAVREALGVLGDNTVVNLMLNQSRDRGANSYYAYGYGYSYEEKK